MQSRRAEHLHHPVDYTHGDRRLTTYKIKAARPTSTATFTQVPEV